MSKIFQSVAMFKPKKSKFDLSHERKMSAKMGYIIPFFAEEIMPGDKFRVSTEMLLRMQPMIAPMMHRVRIKTDFFYVPNRLVWDNWQKFITGGEKGTDTPVHPKFELSQVHVDAGYLAKGSLYDYLGLPTINGGETLTHPLYVNALPFRAYQLIYNEYYRDQNLQDPIPFSKGDGSEVVGENIKLRKSAWEKDYFTSCLPWAQKGGAVVAPVEGTLTGIDLAGTQVLKQSDNTGAAGALTATLGELEAPAGTRAKIPVTGSVEMTEGGININELRITARLQEWLERNARAGSRYIENILANFGVLSSDARLQRPEYLGGSITPIVVSEVLSTFQNADDSGYPQGTMSGHGIAAGGYGGFKRSFEEHGWVFGVMRVLPRTAYQQGIPKSMQRFDKLEYAWPSFAQLGEQEVKNSELYFQANGGDGSYNDGVFGYQSRYAEYKYKPSTVHGDFRDNLSFWHMGRIFEEAPLLNESFIMADPTKRIFAVTTETEDELLVQIYNRVDAIRPLPYYNSPTL